MGRYIFNNFVDGYSAMVSTHGHFSVTKGEKSATYQSSIYHHGTVVDSHGNTVDMPEFIYEGPVSELGITYDVEYDDLVRDHDSHAFIESRLQFWWLKIGRHRYL